MFTTFVLLCHVMTKECMTVQDVRGPYTTEKQCVERAAEMREDLQDGLPYYRVVSYKCMSNTKGIAT